MPFSKAGQLARVVRTARTDDPIGLVAENLRESPHGVLPVLDRDASDDEAQRKARVIGLITQNELSFVTKKLLETPVANGHWPPATPEIVPETGSDISAQKTPELRENEAATGANSTFSLPEIVAATESPSARDAALTPERAPEKPLFSDPLLSVAARDVMRSDVPFIPAVFSLHNALLTLERYGYTALPVIDEAGQYLGLISRADVISALGKSVRPPLVGGMATPVGVYLTDGRLSGGAKGFALVLSGVLTAFLLIVSQILLAFGVWLINPEWGILAFSGRAGLIGAENGSLANSLVSLAHGLLFLTLLRFSPIAGYHAAEHQTVHALERGLPLEVQYVDKMPRAHPRCGTNLVALGGLLTIGFQHLRSFDQLSVLLVFVFAFFFWRALGTFLQETFTTRPATRKQLENGIAAARELMEKYQAQPFAESARPLRLLNGGMLPVIAGMTLALFVLLAAWDFAARALLGANVL